MHSREDLEISATSRGTYALTEHVQRVVRESGIRDGACTVFVHHTSASLVVTENADPDVRRDLDTFLGKLVRDGDPSYLHQSEGPDDMAAHIRTALTQVSLTIPVKDGCADLGTWQGIFLWEHRTSPHTRRVSVTVLGE